MTGDGSLRFNPIVFEAEGGKSWGCVRLADVGFSGAGSMKQGPFALRMNTVPLHFGFLCSFYLAICCYSYVLLSCYTPYRTWNGRGRQKY